MQALGREIPAERFAVRSAADSSGEELDGAVGSGGSAHFVVAGRRGGAVQRPAAGTWTQQPAASSLTLGPVL